MNCHFAKASATIGLIAVAAFAGPLALAEGAGWYLGENVGKSRVAIDDPRIRGNLLNEGFATTSLSDHDRDTGFKVFGGYQLNPHFAIEGGYFDLGKFGFMATTMPAGTLRGEIKVNGLNLDLVGILPLAERWSAFARAGLIDAKSKDRFTGTGSVTVVNPNPRKRAVSYKFGFGLEYDFTTALGMRVEAERFRVPDAVGRKGDVDLLSVGLVYRFSDSAPAPAYVPPPPVAAPVPAPAPAPPPVAARPPAPIAPPPPRRVSFSADALFSFDKAIVRPEGVRALETLARELRGTTYDHVHVYGYTDRIGSEAYNLRLSQRRADAVKAYLVDTAGLEAGKIAAEGRGKSDPVTKPGECEGTRSPAVIACLQPDRRVDIEVRGTQR